MSDFLYDTFIGAIVLFVGIFTAVASVTLPLIAWWSANDYKYNCNLEHRPDLYTAFMINDNRYAYDPQGFCNQLKEKMHK